MKDDRIHGVVTRVFLTRGFAFVHGDDGQDYFLQADQLVGPWEGSSVHEGRMVSFAPRSDGRKGNGLRATEVVPC